MRASSCRPPKPPDPHRERPRTEFFNNAGRQAQRARRTRSPHRATLARWAGLVVARRASPNRCLAHGLDAGGPTDGSPRAWPRPDCADTSVGSDDRADILRTGFAAQTGACERPGEADQVDGDVLGRRPTEHRPSSRDALLVAGLDERHLHQDRASGARDDRPGLKACLKAACEEGACAATERLLDDAPGLDGLVMPVDAFATGAMRVPRGRGLAVPGRVRVATCHDGSRARGAPGPDGGGPAARHGGAARRRSPHGRGRGRGRPRGRARAAAAPRAPRLNGDRGRRRALEGVVRRHRVGAPVVDRAARAPGLTLGLDPRPLRG